MCWCLEACRGLACAVFYEFCNTTSSNCGGDLDTGHRPQMPKWALVSHHILEKQAASKSENKGLDNFPSTYRNPMSHGGDVNVEA
ncbi:Vegetative incompatibility protein HET-E-1 [Fusarium oxysporum f. sp. albedinis]|nr:Vegetative incompatibility protein HET-E-1 [Fusarium oxysporum f. sp. albedinis]